jgi:hypothetical protein
MHISFNAITIVFVFEIVLIDDMSSVIKMCPVVEKALGILV